MNPKVPFPIEKTGFVTKCLNNLGVIMFDKKGKEAFQYVPVKDFQRLENKVRLNQKTKISLRIRSLMKTTIYRLPNFKLYN